MCLELFRERASNSVKIVTECVSITINLSTREMHTNAMWRQSVLRDFSTEAIFNCAERYSTYIHPEHDDPQLAEHRIAVVRSIYVVQRGTLAIRPKTYKSNGYFQFVQFALHATLQMNEMQLRCFCFFVFGAAYFCMSVAHRTDERHS